MPAGKIILKNITNFSYYNEIGKNKLELIQNNIWLYTIYQHKANAW